MFRWKDYNIRIEAESPRPGIKTVRIDMKIGNGHHHVIPAPCIIGITVVSEVFPTPTGYVMFYYIN